MPMDGFCTATQVRPFLNLSQTYSEDETKMPPFTKCRRLCPGISMKAVEENVALHNHIVAQLEVYIGMCVFRGDRVK